MFGLKSIKILALSVVFAVGTMQGAVSYAPITDTEKLFANECKTAFNSYLSNSGAPNASDDVSKKIVDLEEKYKTTLTLSRMQDLEFNTAIDLCKIQCGSACASIPLCQHTESRDAWLKENTIRTAINKKITAAESEMIVTTTVGTRTPQGA